MMQGRTFISRRQFMKVALTGTALAACTPVAPGSSSAPQSDTQADAAQPSAAAANLIYWTGWSGIDLEKQQAVMIDPFNESHADTPVEMQSVFGQYQKVLTSIA